MAATERASMTWRKQRDCARCTRVHYSTDSAICEDCWREMGQMSFEIEEEDAETPRIDSQWDELQ